MTLQLPRFEAADELKERKERLAAERRESIALMEASTEKKVHARSEISTLHFASSRKSMRKVLCELEVAPDSWIALSHARKRIATKTWA